MPKEKIGSDTFTADMEKNKLELSNRIGKDLVKEAITTYQDSQKKLLVGEVSVLMERLSLMLRREEQTSKRISLLRAQIAAIENTEFTIDTRYGIQGSRIKFNTAELNVDWNLTEQW